MTLPTVTATASDDAGTNAPVKTTTETQATPQTAVPVFTPAQINRDNSASGAVPAAPTTSAGVGASSDDKVSDAKLNPTQTSVDNIFGSDALVPQDNVLDQYYSYTYQASFYLMSPKAFQTMVNSKKKSLEGSQLLFQSGGAPVNGRNKYFKNDYYIDNIEIKSVIKGKGTNSAHNATEIKMTVIEPNGITLIENIDQAVQDYLGTVANPPKKRNFQAQLYLLVIKFYGYDAQGNLVNAGKNGVVVEKYYPLSLNNIKFAIRDKLVEYEFLTVPIQYQINTGQLRAVVPYNVELSAGTVSDVLVGNPVSAGTAAADGRDSTSAASDSSGAAPTAPQTAASAPNSKLTVRQGLVAALNQYQQDLVKSKQSTYPDVYSIEFTSSSIGQAKITKSGQDQKADPMPVGGTAKQQLDPKTQSVDNTTRTFTITAGAPMVQVIEQTLRNSSYVEDQQLYKVLESSGAQVPNGSASANNLAWYKINLEATPTQYDPIRNDYAYNIKYVVSPYKINDMVSAYFPTPKYNGVHKQYNYWFTGLNTQVIHYEQTYNSLYTIIMSGGPASLGVTSQDTTKTVPAPRSGQTSQGAQGRANEPAANAADYLYSPGDNNNAELTIVGDPAWLQQGEVTFGVNSKNFDYKGFLPDGTINFDSQQILFEVLFNTPSDYNLQTGLIDPNAPPGTPPVAPAGGNQPGAARRSYIFLAKECVSMFNKGKFTQTLKGVRINYFGDQAAKAAASARPVAAQQAAAGSRDANTVDPSSSAASQTVSSPEFATTDDDGNPLPPTSSTGTTGADGTGNTTNQAESTLVLPSSQATAPTSDGVALSPVTNSPAPLNISSSNPLGIGTGGTSTAGLTPEQIAIQRLGVSLNSTTQNMAKEA